MDSLALPDRFPVRWQLAPAQVAPTAPQPVGARQPGEGIQAGERGATLAFGTESAVGARCWTLVPGERTEVFVRLENSSERAIALRLSGTGEFPLSWGMLSAAPATVPPPLTALATGLAWRLDPGDRVEASLYFLAPADFFESERALGNGGLQLDYAGELGIAWGFVAAEAATRPEQPVGLSRRQAIAFSLHLRPRSLYVEFLPEIYREVDFIGRLLQIFERAFEPDVEILETLWAYLDPMLTPESMLPFLSHWVGWPLLAEMQPARQRVLVQRAMELHRLRGTRRGLRLYLHLVTGLPLDETLPPERQQIAIEEDFADKFALGRSRLGQTTVLGRARPFFFRVRLRLGPEQTADAALVRTIVEQVKPAPCTYEVAIETLPAPTPDTPSDLSVLS